MRASTGPGWAVPEPFECDNSEIEVEQLLEGIAWVVGQFYYREGDHVRYRYWIELRRPRGGVTLVMEASSELQHVMLRTYNPNGDVLEETEIDSVQSQQDIVNNHESAHQRLRTEYRKGGAR